MRGSRAFSFLSLIPDNYSDTFNHMAEYWNTQPSKSSCSWQSSNLKITPNHRFLMTTSDGWLYDTTLDFITSIAEWGLLSFADGRVVGQLWATPVVNLCLYIVGVEASSLTDQARDNNSDIPYSRSNFCLFTGLFANRHSTIPYLKQTTTP